MNHLGWIGILESPKCVCSRDFEIIDYVLWGCERFAGLRKAATFDGFEIN
jgi:hypothetical protein